MVHQLEQLRLDQEQVGDPLRLDRRQRVGGLVAILEHHHASAEQGDVDQHLGQIGQTAIDELPPVGRAGDAHHGRIGGKGPPAALGNTGAAAGRDDHGDVVGTGEAGDRLARLGIRQRIQPQRGTGQVGRHRSHPQIEPGRQEVRGLGEDDEQVGLDLGDERRPRRCRTRRGQKARGGAEQVRRIADCQCLRAVGREQGDQAGAPDPQGGEGTGIAEDRGLEGIGGDA